MNRARVSLSLLLALQAAAWPLAAQTPGRHDPVTRIAATNTPAQAAAALATAMSTPAVDNGPGGVDGAATTKAPADGFKPTWETQKGARTYLLGIPAPRGQIVDRNGSPLAQTRVSYNLGVSFPTPLNFNDRQVLQYMEQQVIRARQVTGRPISVQGSMVLKHYKNRGVLPFIVAQDLKPAELETYYREKPESLTLQPVYLRFYANGPLAAHIIGYAGRAGRMPDKPIENNELMWPDNEGREGLEQTFNDQLSGKVGQYNISFDPSGKKVSEQISIPPQPGYNVVTTLDEHIQQLCEDSLAKTTKRGAMVVMDPNNGDILAMASWPTFNPNLFVPSISAEEFGRLQNDPDIPLLPRAFRSAYPPGSTFKVFVGLAALQTGKVKPGDEFGCPPSMEIGNLTFRNWKKTGSGSLNFVDALTQSCDTWFYQVGMKIGSLPMIDYAQQVGLGKKTGIPLAAEADGIVPTEPYMLKVHGRKFGGGDLANMSIGQGDTTVTPLQLAQGMATVGNGGTLYQARLVQQVQSIDDQVVTPFNPRVRGQVQIDKEIMSNIRRGMVAVVSSRSGTAGKAAVPHVEMAGKTGTAQWGPKHKERTAAWFAGFAPAKEPKYAFAVVYEGDVGADVHGGSAAAPIAGRVFRELFKDEKEQKASKKKNKDDDEADADSDKEKDQDEDDEDAAPRHRPRPAPEAKPAPAPAAPKPKVSFWKKLFG